MPCAVVHPVTYVMHRATYAAPMPHQSTRYACQKQALHAGGMHLHTYGTHESALHIHPPTHARIPPPNQKAVRLYARACGSRCPPCTSMRLYTRIQQPRMYAPRVRQNTGVLVVIAACVSVWRCLCAVVCMYVVYMYVTCIYYYTILPCHFRWLGVTVRVTTQPCGRVVSRNQHTMSSPYVNPSATYGHETADRSTHGVS